jgi:hypothetical protein
MGEIKSTLDLVMERTRHLSLSAEEKAQQKKDEFKKRLRGLVQKYADSALSTDGLLERITELQEEFGIEDRRLLMSEVQRHLDPDRDNEHWLDLLADFMPEAKDPLKEALETYSERRYDLKRVIEQKTLEELENRHGIQGSAVIPNPQKNEAYKESLATLRQETQAEFDHILMQNH